MVKKLICPNCGANMKISAVTENHELVCEYCQTFFYVKQDGLEMMPQKPAQMRQPPKPPIQRLAEPEDANPEKVGLQDDFEPAPRTPLQKEKDAADLIKAIVGFAVVFLFPFLLSLLLS